MIQIKCIPQKLRAKQQLFDQDPMVREFVLIASHFTHTAVAFYIHHTTQSRPTPGFWDKDENVARAKGSCSRCASNRVDEDDRVEILWQNAADRPLTSSAMLGMEVLLRCNMRRSGCVIRCQTDKPAFLPKII
jgi:hypothetical protein